MEKRISSIIAAGCLVLIQSAAADIIALKDGEKINGTIIREDGDDYIVEVVISGTIRDERRIARNDVKFIDKKGDDEKAFEEIGIPVPIPDLVEKGVYEEWLSKLEAFIKDYPESPKSKEAKELLDTVGSEHAVIAAGGIKFGGEMVSADDYEANAYEYDGKIAEKRIRNAVARRDFLSSLRLYSEYREQFGQSEESQGMDALILQVLGAYKATLDENMSSLERRLEKRKSGLASMTMEDRAKTERALEEQMEKIQKRYDKEKAAGQKWVTPDSFHKQSMDEALREVGSETARLSALPEPKPLDVPLAKVYRVAWGKISDAVAEEKGMIVEVSEEVETKPDKATVEERKRAALALEERKKVLEGEKKKIIEEAKASGLTEFYLGKLRTLAGFVEN